MGVPNRKPLVVLMPALAFRRRAFFREQDSLRDDRIFRAAGFVPSFNPLGAPEHRECNRLSFMPWPSGWRKLLPAFQ